MRDITFEGRANPPTIPREVREKVCACTKSGKHSLDSILLLLFRSLCIGCGVDYQMYRQYAKDVEQP